MRGQTEPFTPIRDVSLKQQLERPLFKGKLRRAEGGGARPGHAQCRGHAVLLVTREICK